MSDGPILDGLGVWPNRLCVALAPEGVELSDDQVRDVLALLFRLEPIDTAPKDGTEVELWSKEWTNCEIASFESHGKWLSDDGWILDRPTHWRHRMPVPATPLWGEDDDE